MIRILLHWVEAWVRLDILVFTRSFVLLHGEHAFSVLALGIMMLRGNGRRDILFDESDRLRFYDLLALRSPVLDRPLHGPEP